MSIIFCMTTISCNTFIGMSSEINIGKYILKNTPIGTSKDYVRKFIRKKNFKIDIDSNTPYYLEGITMPVDYPESDYPRNYKTPMGSSYIYVLIADLINTTTLCAWIFNEEEELILIDLIKERYLW